MSGVPYSIPVSGVAGGNGGDCSSFLLSEAALAALQRFLPSNEPYVYEETRRGVEQEEEEAEEEDLLDSPVDAYSCDEFRMYEFKVRRCVRGRSHDWTECPYAHPGEKARRRDPRKFHYSGVACPDFRKGVCKRGDACEYAHGVFECWLHPSRYRTQACKDGVNCRRRVCFFAHTPEQLRVVPQAQQQQQQQSPPVSSVLDSYFSKGLASSPTSTLMSPPMSPPSDSPPLSPSGHSLRRSPAPVGSSPINGVLASLRRLQLSKAKSVPSSWGLQQVSGVGSPRGVVNVRPGFCSLPTTPTAASSGGLFDEWTEPTERVESGRDLRVKIYEKLSREFSMGRSHEEEDEARAAAAMAPDVGWVSDLVM